MLSMRSQFELVLIVMALLNLPVKGWAQDSQVQGQAAVAAATPTLPAELAQVPPGKSELTYVNRQLTIRAHDAPLIEVVRAVCSQIGAELDAPSEPDDRVLGVFGPGPSRDVLTAMMAGSHFNLAMAGSPGDPNALVRIVILPNSADSADKANNGSEAPPAQDSVARDQATEQQDRQAAEEPVASMPTASDVQSRISQVREVFAQVRTEFSQLTEATDLDLDTVLKEAEAQAKAAAAADPNTPPPIAVATNHPRGRSRHTH
jgi:hypothetical protein